MKCDVACEGGYNTPYGFFCAGCWESSDWEIRINAKREAKNNHNEL